MGSEWFTRTYRSILENNFVPTSKYGVQNRLRALVGPNSNRRLERVYEYW